LELAEGQAVGQFEKGHPSGAKAPMIFCSIYGTRELVPFQIGLKLTLWRKASSLAVARALVAK
jgi:hypothetical protein